MVAQPFHTIAMDMVGPLLRSKVGHKYILTICDYGTKYPEAIPLRNTDGKHVAEELVMVFSRVGIPEKILTDCGSNFTSRLMEKLYQLLGIKSITTSPYHPQTDGMVKRFNATLKHMLRKLLQKFDSQWDKALSYLLFAYQEVPQAATGFSPFELLYGRQVRGPLDVLKETWEQKETTSDSVVSFVQRVQERLAFARELAQSNETTAKEQMKNWYDRTAREGCLKPATWSWCCFSLNPTS